LSKTIYVFRCSGTGLYALTTDPSGHILPSRIYPRIRWQFERRATLRVEKNSSKQEIVRETLDAITKQGFYLTHEAIGGTASLRREWTDGAFPVLDPRGIYSTSDACSVSPFTTMVDNGVGEGSARRQPEVASSAYSSSPRRNGHNLRRGGKSRFGL
jgi:hypothetical protein